jgi:hypothetical protein
MYLWIIATLFIFYAFRFTILAIFSHLVFILFGIDACFKFIKFSIRHILGVHLSDDQIIKLIRASNEDE